MSVQKHKLLKGLKVVFIFALLIVVTSVLVRELSHIDFKRTFLLFNRINSFELMSLFLLGAISIVLLSLYDVILQSRFKLDLSKFKALRVGYIINAFNNIIGFGGFIGAGVRLWFYQQYTDQKKKLVQFVTYMLTSMLTGLSFLSLLVVTHILDVSFLDQTSIWVTVFLYVIAALLPVFIVVSWIWPIDKTARWLGASFTIISSFEWFMATVVFYFALHLVDASVSFSIVLGVFIVAAISGLLSFIPGGFGAFDLVILLGFKYFGLPEEKIVLALLLYRIAYYFFPLFIALILTFFEFGTAAKKYIYESKYIQPAKEVSAFLMSFQKDAISYIPSFVLGCLVLIMSGVSLLNNFGIVFDATTSKHHIIYISLYILNVSAALVLLLNVRGIMLRSKRAILFAIVAALIIITSNAYVYGVTITLVLGILLVATLFFAYQKSRVLKRPIRIRSLVYMGFITAMVLYFNQILVKSFIEALGIEIPKVDMFLLRSSFWLSFLGMTILVVAIIKYFERHYLKPHTFNDMAVAQDILQTYGGHLLSHLVHSGDKHVFVNEAKNAFLMYRHTRESFIVLGDPIGDSDGFYSLLTEFYDHATYLGADVMFYQVSEEQLSLYHAFGNQFFKLGEEALIDVPNFTVAGKKRRGFRATLNKFESQGYTFEILDTPLDEETYQRLRKVSDTWLGQQSEFYFSVGHFNRKYINAAPVAVLRNAEGRIDAFATLMPVDQKTTISVDLIRWDREIDLPFMDGLYLNMILWAQTAGYAQFNMGMATLSNVGQVPYGHAKEKVVGRFYEHFNGLYSFQGLRQYKSKFGPHWESRYLIYHRQQTVWVSLLRVTRVIRKKYKASV
ncbi:MULTISPECIES: bifunctional lysylphosphatidylglycerol flippase/synthetase MprF [unclassified Staphylococcus]|uniref:bifunctional lysylphosphatidylglycerol flippase/synthetase MprF n=1 Tax=unclassified Staphylococcus TaxID=91994 RepID=UPI0021D2FE6E|nr:MULTISPECIES: bifunctional lysylphosphatidylglycerol flippase/synthetase MprF [unclassified Staphylococcus]UXR68807.1 bifunctional lysylphosphatidylglycerol flippase/synthetase MprF [Staphylococcus sp. IVB6246]UXR73094.1 bifunctional lysylphosphatidylglycerol flippase/synthetase MprF [Staphylococcus sp. IVB6238]UXR75390.1 bifunctional lysylphosphatidylglycerol flippase/synthetase MprF [Staphylococcus sp. IVB6233]UXR79593.1 bifunctional lysylphosphatidylglycerol flippase/synthetase MprF [Stap